MNDEAPNMLVQRLKSTASGLERAMTAYGHLMAASQGQVDLPTLVWPARDGDAPVEVHTDLNMLAPDIREEILKGMAAVHGAEIHKSLSIVGELHVKLVAALTPAPAEPDGDTPAAAEPT